MSDNGKCNRPVIVFDIGGVLIDWNPKFLYRKVFNGDEEKVDFFLTEICPYSWNLEQDKGRSFEEAVTEKAAEFPEYESQIRAYHERWMETVRDAYPETVEVLSALRGKDYMLCALTNWGAEKYALMSERFDFLNWFEETVVSGEEGVLKPDPAIYQILLERIQCEAEQCIFIDDREANVVTASQLGFDAIHFTSADNLVLELKERELL
jgi:2-haloacid dehalogenase